MNELNEPFLTQLCERCCVKRFLSAVEVEKSRRSSLTAAARHKYKNEHAREERAGGNRRRALSALDQPRWSPAALTSKFCLRTRAVTALTFYDAQATLVKKKLGGLDVPVLNVDACQAITVDTAIVLTTSARLTPFLVDARRSLVAFSRDRLGLYISSTQDFLRATPAGRAMCANINKHCSTCRKGKVYRQPLGPCQTDAWQAP